MLRLHVSNNRGPKEANICVVPQRRIFTLLPIKNRQAHRVSPVGVTMEVKWWHVMRHMNDQWFLKQPFQVSSFLSIYQVKAKMSDRISKKLTLVHNSGVELFPYKITSRTTGNTAFHVSLGRNALGQGEEIDSIDEVIDRVLNKGYKVRAKSLDGKVTGSYKVGDRAIASHHVDKSLNS